MKHFIITLDYKFLSDNEYINQRVRQYEIDALIYFHERFICDAHVTYNDRTKYHRIKVDFPHNVPVIEFSNLPYRLSGILLSNMIPLTVIKLLKSF